MTVEGQKLSQYITEDYLLRIYQRLREEIDKSKTEFNNHHYEEFGVHLMKIGVHINSEALFQAGEREIVVLWPWEKAWAYQKIANFLYEAESAAYDVAPYYQKSFIYWKDTLLHSKEPVIRMQGSPINLLEDLKKAKQKDLLKEINNDYPEFIEQIRPNRYHLILLEFTYLMTNILPVLDIYKLLEKAEKLVPEKTSEYHFLRYKVYRELNDTSMAKEELDHAYERPRQGNVPLFKFFSAYYLLEDQDKCNEIITKSSLQDIIIHLGIRIPNFLFSPLLEETREREQLRRELQELYQNRLQSLYKSIKSGLIRSLTIPGFLIFAEILKQAKLITEALEFSLILFITTNRLIKEKNPDFYSKYIIDLPEADKYQTWDTQFIVEKFNCSVSWRPPVNDKYQEMATRIAEQEKKEYYLNKCSDYTKLVTLFKELNQPQLMEIANKNRLSCGKEIPWKKTINSIFTQINGYFYHQNYLQGKELIETAIQAIDGSKTYPREFFFPYIRLFEGIEKILAKERKLGCVETKEDNRLLTKQLESMINKRPFTNLPPPFNYYYVYPKGSPAASPQGIRKIAAVCPHCGEPNPQRKHRCSSCGVDLTPQP